MVKTKKSPAQQVAMKRYPNSKVSFNDFSLAQGYAACYRERVEPLLELLKRVMQVGEHIGHPANDALPQAISKALDEHQEMT